VFEVWWKITEEMSMKKLTTIFLLLFSINGYCEWTSVSFTDEGISYVDFSTIKKSGNYLRSWGLTNYKDNTSQVYLTEFDCVEDRSRDLSLTGYSGPMGTGNPRTVNITSKWDYHRPNTMGFILLKSVCRK